MKRDYKILVISDDECLQNRMQVILEFLGEPVIVADNKSWKQLNVLADELLCVITGFKKLNSKEATILNEVHDFGNEVPFILVTEIELKTKLSTKIEHQTVAKLNYQFGHGQLLTALHDCQIALENNSAIDNKGKNRPVPLFRSLVGVSDSIKKVRELIHNVCDTEANVLILGETGTGKEVVARNIHYHSSRQGKPFVSINCGAIPHDLLESELFGHEKGAFTGAHSARMGKFELAHTGTIFLDEIGDMPLAMQVKLLRVLQERSFEKVGGNKTIEIDVRVIAATHRDLTQEITKNTFREDLFYRLNVFPIRVPALRERIEDLPLLINELLARIEGQKRNPVNILDEAIEQLSLYTWPGNVRELANIIERLAIMHPNEIIGRNELPDKFKELSVNLFPESVQIAVKESEV